MFSLYFNLIVNVNKIVFMGLSMGEQDLIYIDKIKGKLEEI